MAAGARRETNRAEGRRGGTMKKRVWELRVGAVSLPVEMCFHT